MLSDCHRRIERFLDVLAKVAADLHGHELNNEEKIALSAALKYFRDSAPKHTADEELSLFPRMRQSDDPEVRGALAELERLEADHVRVDRLHREVDALGEAWLRNGCLPEQSADRLQVLTAKLREIYSAHIAMEDSRVFPIAQRALDVETRQVIGREMAARRKVAVVELAD